MSARRSFFIALSLTVLALTITFAVADNPTGRTAVLLVGGLLLVDLALLAVWTLMVTVGHRWAERRQAEFDVHAEQALSVIDEGDQR